MFFNSLEYFVFLPVVLTLYWLSKRNTRLQNIVLLIASYFFYGWWDWRFLLLILFSSLVDYIIGLKMYSSSDKKHKKLLLAISLFVNLGLLGFFKYYNFFIESLVQSWDFFGFTLNTSTLNIILPVGISFYTFQTLSYSLDIYKGKLKPVNDFISFATFVSFFPQLVAGPIERATNFLPQVTTKRTWSYNQSVEGLRLILWGMFKKVIIADSLAPMVNEIFGNYSEYSSPMLILGAVYFAFQIYGDFSGYSDIAIGTAKLFGFELMSNFKFPYFSRDIAEFWRRWHISLSTWFRDYLYIPLGGSRVPKAKAIRNIFAIFLVSGFWHGANWTFIIWGGVHSLLFMPKFLLGTNRKYTLDAISSGSFFQYFKEAFQIVSTFALVCFAWIFFRADTVSVAIDFITRIFSFQGGKEFYHPYDYKFLDYNVLIIVFVIYEYFHRNNERNPFQFKNQIVRYLAYILVLFTFFLYYNVDKNTSFIYFQF